MRLGWDAWSRNRNQKMELGFGQHRGWEMGFGKIWAGEHERDLFKRPVIKIPKLLSVKCCKYNSY